MNTNGNKSLRVGFKRASVGFRSARVDFKIMLTYLRRGYAMLFNLGMRYDV